MWFADIILDGDEGRHAVRSLRLREGTTVELCDGRGAVLRAEITAVDKASNRAWVSNHSTVECVIRVNL